MGPLDTRTKTKLRLKTGATRGRGFALLGTTLHRMWITQTTREITNFEFSIMRNLLPAHQLIEVAKVFAYNDALCFKRLAADTFFVPLFYTPCAFDIAINANHNVSFTPVSLSLKANKTLNSVRDLLNSDTCISRAVFTCFYDPKFLLSSPRWQTTITVAYKNTIFALNCKVYVPKYEKFYSNLVSNTGRKHVTIRVENVKATASKRYLSP